MGRNPQFTYPNNYHDIYQMDAIGLLQLLYYSPYYGVSSGIDASISLRFSESHTFVTAIDHCNDNSIFPIYV